MWKWKSDTECTMWKSDTSMSASAGVWHSQASAVLVGLCGSPSKGSLATLVMKCGRRHMEQRSGGVKSSNFNPVSYTHLTLPTILLV
eukprot:3359873-Amphidinium_carterae.1